LTSNCPVTANLQRSDKGSLSFNSGGALFTRAGTKMGKKIPVQGTSKVTNAIETMTGRWLGGKGETGKKVQNKKKKKKTTTWGERNDSCFRR